MAGDERQRRETVKGTSWISRNRERKERVGGERHGEKDRSRDDGEIGYLQITSLCDRFLWRLNWAHGLRGNQSKS